MTAPDSTPTPAGTRPVDSPPPRRPDDPGAPFPIEVRLSPRATWAIIGVFMALIVLPGVGREFSSDSVRHAMAAVFRPSSEPVTDRLRALEKRIDEGAWTGPIRQRMQTVLYRVFGEGNRKVLVGRDGWLFHRPGVQALTGRGPVLGPTHSVAKDPSLKAWEGPIPVIREFAAQLNERGLKLVLIPVPDKAALWSSHLSPSAAGPAHRRRHPDWPAFVSSLRDTVEIVELDALLPYLPDDTHWQPAGARAAAAIVAAHLRAESVDPPDPSSTLDRSDQGDLVASLGLASASVIGRQSSIRLPSTTPVLSVPTAPLVLLGDSNVNMYDDPGLPFHQPGAGFGSWLQACLGAPLHLIAINGGGATQVRQRFAALPDDVVRAKKIVVWVLAERDLWMDPPVARANGVEWKRVVFNPHPTSSTAPAAPTSPTAPGPPLVIEATLRAKSALLDVTTVPYRDAVFTAEFTVDQVVSGSYSEKELTVVLWNFRDRVIQPTARLVPGQKVRFTLSPWLDQGELTKVAHQDDFLRFDLPLLYAEKTEILSP